MTAADRHAIAADDPHAIAAGDPDPTAARGVPVYPVFLRLEGEPVVVVGGGAVAAGKLDGLRAAGARVTVIAPDVSAACRRPGVAIVARGFENGDLDGARFVIAAATPAVNRAVAIAARARNLFVNAVDDRAAASAFLGGVVRRGDVTIAISTGGAAPALAALLREAIAATLPDDLEAWVETATDLRARWRAEAAAGSTDDPGGRAEVVPIADRRERLFAALAAARAKAATAAPGAGPRGAIAHSDGAS